MKKKYKTKEQLIRELAEIRQQAGDPGFRELKKTREYLENVLENSPDGIAIVDGHGRFVKCNKMAEELYGCNFEELKGKKAFDFYPDKKEIEKMLEQLRHDGVVKRYEINMKKKDGTVVPSEISISLLKNAENRTIGSICVARDLSDIKKALIEIEKTNKLLNQEVVTRQQVLRTLEDSEERYRLLVSNIPALVFEGYCNWEVEFFDDKIERLTGYRKEEFNSGRLKWKDVVLEEDLPILKQVFKQALKSDKSYIREYRIKSKEGKIIWLQERSRIICHIDGRVDYVSGVFFDITARRQAEDDLCRAHAEFEQLLASITGILLGLSPAGVVWHWNVEAEKVLGVKAAAALGHKLNHLPIPWDVSRISDALAACRKRPMRTKLENVRFRRHDGKNGFLGITISPTKGEAEEISGLILQGKDVTEKVMLETQLAQSQKLESIGQLAAGIAHEINTPIQYVGDNTRFLRDAFQDLLRLLEGYQDLFAVAKTGAATADFLRGVETASREIDLDYLVEEIPAAINQSLEGVERVARIVRAMKDFSHLGTAEKRAVDINKSIESTITVARNEYKYVAELVTDLDPSLPLVPCWPDEFNQVILNILINAAQAIAEVLGREPEKKGTITIKTRKNGDRAEISISDTGGGIPKEIRTRIFDPFFTTKEVGKGTGQGLAISHAVIVDKHGGAINFETAMGQGTTFIIRLPLEPVKPEKG